MIETEYAIGDVIYTASASDIDREIIKAIKVVGVKNRISYGVKAGGGSLGILGSLYGSSDGYRWYSSSDIFKDMKDAEKRQEKLIKRRAEKDSTANLKEILDMEARLKLDQENLRRKKQGLHLIEDEDDY